MHYKDPINYQLTNEDIDSKDYVNFLDKLTDVPSSEALKPFSIDRAGIKEQYAYVRIRPLFGKGSYVTVLVNVSMQVDLSDHRGIHMSRCEEALFSLAEEDHESLDLFAKKLSEKILDLQKAQRAYVSVEAVYIHKRKTVRSNKISHDRITLYADALANIGKEAKLQIGLAAFNMTGCPCTETFTKFSIVPQLKEAGFDLEEIKTVLSIANSGTHTQRGIAKIEVDKTNQAVNYEKLFKILDESCHLVFELLKRPDEHELVIRVLKNPQFTEDVVRDVVANTIKQIGEHLADDSRVFASSQLFDSIHIHDVYTEIDKTYGELAKEL